MVGILQELSETSQVQSSFFFRTPPREEKLHGDLVKGVVPAMEPNQLGELREAVVRREPPVPVRDVPRDQEEANVSVERQAGHHHRHAHAREAREEPESADAHENALSGEERSLC